MILGLGDVCAVCGAVWLTSFFNAAKHPYTYRLHTLTRAARGAHNARAPTHALKTANRVPPSFMSTHNIQQRRERRHSSACLLIRTTSSVQHCEHAAVVRVLRLGAARREPRRRACALGRPDLGPWRQRERLGRCVLVRRWRLLLWGCDLQVRRRPEGGGRVDLRHPRHPRRKAVLRGGRRHPRHLGPGRGRAGRREIGVLPFPLALALLRHLAPPLRDARCHRATGRRQRRRQRRRRGGGLQRRAG